MAEIERPPIHLVENVLTLLAHDDEGGKVVAAMVDPSLFEGDYQIIAERFITYWREHSKAPKAHAADLLPELYDRHNRRGPIFKRMLHQMLALHENINRDFVLSQLRTFVRHQRLKQTILRSAERLQNDQLAVPEVEEMWSELLRSRDIAFEPGTKLTEYEKVLDKLRTTSSEFTMGIHELDTRHVVPFREGVMLIIGSAKAGKTWCLVHIGKKALMNRKRVLHLTLEMGEAAIAQRYYQSLFAVPKRDTPTTVTHLIKDNGRLKGFTTSDIQSDFSFSSHHIREELEAHLGWFGNRLDNLIIKQFPPRSLSMSGLRSFLDNLEVTHRFVPDMVILDYMGIVKTDEKNHRISLGRQFEEFRGIMVERSMAGVTAHQSSKAGSEAKLVQAKHGAEDWSMIGTADAILTFTRTPEEKTRGLGRLYVENLRGEADSYGVLITQAYNTGQFVLESAMLGPNYFDLIKKDDDDGGGDDEPRRKRDLIAEEDET